MIKEIGHWIKMYIIGIGRHFVHLGFIYFVLLFLVFSSVFCEWFFFKRIIYVALILLTLFLSTKPLNIVYGLMGTSGSISIFFTNFVIISFLFSTIYYFGFFKDAGISYDINQPHIDYLYYVNSEKGDPRISVQYDTIFVEHQLDSISFKETLIHENRDSLHYQRIGFVQLWRSSILTTLTQESVDLLSIATVHNEAMESTDPEMDKEKSELFEWILIFHIIISWIFFGVFISLLYNKFRYES